MITNRSIKIIVWKSCRLVKRMDLKKKMWWRFLVWVHKRVHTELKNECMQNWKGLDGSNFGLKRWDFHCVEIRWLVNRSKKSERNTVCPKLFGAPKMYQNRPQMSNYCAQLPQHTRLYIHGRPQMQKSPYGYTQGPKFKVFQNVRIQTIFEGMKKTYFKFNHINHNETCW